MKLHMEASNKNKEPRRIELFISFVFLRIFHSVAMRMLANTQDNTNVRTSSEAFASIRKAQEMCNVIANTFRLFANVVSY